MTEMTFLQMSSSEVVSMLKEDDCLNDLCDVEDKAWWGLVLNLWMARKITIANR